MQRLAVSRMPLIAGLLAVAVISAIILVRHERRIGAPLIPVRLLRRDPSIWRATRWRGFPAGRCQPHWWLPANLLSGGRWCFA